jgi:peptide deformylase
MALLPILTAPHPILKKKALPVERVDDKIRLLLDDMLETMYDAPGIGLAAPQIGQSIRALVFDIGRTEEEKQPYYIINPEYIWLSDHDSHYEEGCLSVPEHYAEVVRPAELKLQYLNRNGNLEILEAKGLMATVIQHEIDHLDGLLFIDHLSNLKRNMIMRKLLKSRKSESLGS